MLLFCDTETTGKLDFRLPLMHPAQPRLVQVAAYLAERGDDGALRHVASVNEIVRPDGWQVPPEATAIHGISHERAAAFGLPLDEVLSRVLTLVDEADESMGVGRFVAHNVPFDNRILLSELARTGNDVTRLGVLRPFCTMQSLTDRMRLPGRWPGKYKWPTLDEAYQFCFARPIADRATHSAMVDLLACKDIFEHGTIQGWWA